MKVITMKGQEQYELGRDGSYTVRDYLNAKPFSSFLSGLAGIWGKPMWAHYVNRGQAIACFGIQDKNMAFLEFQSARLHQTRNALEGFRTFLRLSRKNSPTIVYEPFRQHAPDAGIEQVLTVFPHALALQETNRSLGIEVSVDYCTLASDCIPGLLRRVRIRNLGGDPLEVEMLDGLPRIMTYGLVHSQAKNLPFVSEGYLEVVGDPGCLPLIRLSTRNSDSWKMERMRGGHCFAGVARGGGPILPSVVDPDRVFGEYREPVRAWVFEAEHPYDPAAKQRTHCQSCCGFIYQTLTLAPDTTEGIDSCWTTFHRNSETELLRSRISQPGWFDSCFAEADRVTRPVMDRAFLASGSAEMNSYMTQTYLDNTLRGGLPLSLSVAGRDPVVFHVFNRKHGDLERDYNFFSLAPTYFSQGNGNFRDVNQNRRCDVWFNPDVRESNIRYFANLIQPDGY